VRTKGRRKSPPRLLSLTQTSLLAVVFPQYVAMVLILAFALALLCFPPVPVGPAVRNDEIFSVPCFQILPPYCGPLRLADFVLRRHRNTHPTMSRFLANRILTVSPPLYHTILQQTSLRTRAFPVNSPRLQQIRLLSEQVREAIDNAVKGRPAFPPTSLICRKTGCAFHEGDARGPTMRLLPCNYSDPRITGC
jgi:hypothetical protein